MRKLCGRSEAQDVRQLFQLRRNKRGTASAITPTWKQYKPHISIRCTQRGLNTPSAPSGEANAHLDFAPSSTGWGWATTDDKDVDVVPQKDYKQKNCFLSVSHPALPTLSASRPFWFFHWSAFMCEWLPFIDQFLFSVGRIMRNCQWPELAPPSLLPISWSIIQLWKCLIVVFSFCFCSISSDLICFQLPSLC